MAVVEFLISDFEKLCGFPKEKIIEGLTNIGAPCEEEPEVKKIIVELTPNRPDWFALEGLARSLRAYYKGEIKNYSAKKGDYKVNVDSSVEKIRPYTVCAVVRGLNFTDERIVDMVQVQEKLNATLGRRVKKFGMGLYPLDKIAFPVRYTTMKPEEIKYQPLDYPNVANAREIIEKHPKGQEYGQIIKGFEKWPVFVDANNKIMALIPIVNSSETGKVGLDTKDVFIEVTGTDGNAITVALNIIVTMFADMGGVVYSVDVKYPHKKIVTPDLKPKKMKIDLKNVNKLLGLKLTVKEFGVLANRMGYETEGSNVLVPPYRADVIHEVDVIEDIAIAYGYNKFEPTLPNFFTPGKLNRTLDNVHATLRGMGFLETTTFILTNPKKIESVGYIGEVKRIMNPSGEDYTCLRPMLLQSMLDVLELNKTKGLPQKFYEIGEVFEQGRTKKKLIFAIVDKEVEFSDARGYLQTLMKELGVLQFSLGKTNNSAFDSFKAGEILVENKDIGTFGKVDLRLLERFRLEFDVYAAEIDVEELV